ncbi:ABC transporter substrate-binding protein [Hahella sp. SMD15-11]|uniref:ABC transporter substrate-binding protein n=1 Tax=Thermohahella caldifontis TaxID=3142973 RepID=A0AB39V1I4_9GAMM
MHSRHMTRWLTALLTAVVLVIPGLAAAKQVLRVANMGEPASLDPHFMSGTWENNIAGEMFLALLTEDAKGDAIPGAAESWTISEDGKTYIFKLRDHQWSDGTPVTAKDFQYAFRRVLNPETAAEYASLLYIIKNAEAGVSPFFTPAPWRENHFGQTSHQSDFVFFVCAKVARTAPVHL